jgi:CRISPR/Cas system-associated exonuclease Cas4 (RecB family)
VAGIVHIHIWTVIVGEKMALRFSKSKLGDYKNCPRKFYLKNFTFMGSRRPTAEPDYLTNGKTCHEYYENYNKGIEFNLDLCNDFVKTNVRNFHNLLGKYGLDKAIYAEQKNYDPDLDLVTVIDAVYKKEGEYWLIDYKTGKLYKPKKGDLNFELYLYVYAAEKFLGITIDRMGMFFTMYPDDSFVVKVSRKRLATAMERYKTEVDKIYGLQFPRIYGPLCKYCDFIYCCESYKDDIVE